MKNRWNLLGDIQENEVGEIEASCFVPTDSPWFEGHFPGEPILPGIALVHTAQQAILQNAQKKNEQVKLGELRRIRFVQPVRPGEKLHLNITREETKNAGDEVIFSFKILKGENIVSSGLIIGKKIK